jgi:dsDNA-binding SOS-regulon protein
MNWLNRAPISSGNGGSEGQSLFFAVKREIKWAELRLIMEGGRRNGKQEVQKKKKGEEKKGTWVMKFGIGQLCVCCYIHC